MSEFSLSPYSDTPTSATSMSADEPPTLAAKSFHASCSSPYEYSLSKRAKMDLEPSMMRSNVLRARYSVACECVCVRCASARSDDSAHVLSSLRIPRSV